MKIIFSLILFGALSFAKAQSPQPDAHVQWGETDSTSYVEMKNGKFGIVMEGKVTVPTKYDIEDFQTAVNWDGNAYFSDGADFVLGLDGKWGIMNNRGVVKVPFEYDYIRMERGNDDQQLECAGVMKNGKVAIMDASGKLLTGFDFDAFYGYYHNDNQMTISSTKLAVEKDKKILFFDRQTKKLLTANDDVYNTPESKIVSWRGKYGVICRNGQILLPAEYDNIFSADVIEFNNRIQPLKVSKDKKTGIWQVNRGFIIPMQYENVLPAYTLDKTYYLIAQNSKYAIFDSAGKPASDFIYTEFEFAENYFFAFIGKEKYAIAADGKATLVTGE